MMHFMSSFINQNNKNIYVLMLLCPKINKILIILNISMFFLIK